MAAAASLEAEEAAVVVVGGVAAPPTPTTSLASPPSSPSSPASIEIISASNAASSSGDRVGQGRGEEGEELLLLLWRRRAAAAAEAAAELEEAATPPTPTPPTPPMPGRWKLRAAADIPLAASLPGRDGSARSLLYSLERLDDDGDDAKRQKRSSTTPEAAASDSPSERSCPGDDGETAAVAPAAWNGDVGGSVSPPVLLLPRRLPGGTRRGSFIAVKSQETRKRRPRSVTAASALGERERLRASSPVRFVRERQLSSFSSRFLLFSLPSLLFFSLIRFQNQCIPTPFCRWCCYSCWKNIFEKIPRRYFSFSLLFLLEFFPSSYFFPLSNAHRPRQEVVDGEVGVAVRDRFRVFRDGEHPGRGLAVDGEEARAHRAGGGC